MSIENLAISDQSEISRRLNWLSEDEHRKYVHENMIMREMFLTMLLEGQIYSDEDFQFYKDQAGFSACGECYRIVIISIEDFGCFTENDSSVAEEDRRLARLAIRSIVDEIQSQFSGSFYCVVREGCIVYLFFLDSSQNAFSTIDSNLSHAADVLMKQFQVSIKTTKSNFIDHYSTIANTYNDLQDEIDIRRFFESDMIASDAIQMPSENQFTLNNRLINCLQIRDYVGSKEAIDAIIDDSISRLSYSNQNAKIQFYYLLNVIMQTGSRISEDMGDYLQNVGFEQRISEALSVSELRNVLNECFSEIIDADRLKTEERMPKWFFDCLEFLDKHYTDQMLTISVVAESVGLSPAYLSSVFKQYSGIGMLEYIHKKRISLSKNLLRNGATVKQASERAGYASVVTMNRSFLKYEGTTPGHFRKFS